jgi:DNA-binding transcriptional LysR family regulator
VLAGTAHLGVCAIDLLPAGLAATELLRTPLCLAMPARHPLARRRRLPLTALAGARLIVSPAGQLHHELVGRALSRLPAEQLGPEPIEADGWPLMLRFVQLGLGVAIVNGVCALPAGTVARPLPELGSITYRLVRRRGAKLPAEAERLAALLHEHTARFRS